MGKFASVTLAIGATVAVILGGLYFIGSPRGVGSPSPSPTVAPAIPTSPPLGTSTVFKSTTYGYQITLPPSWTAVPAAGRWDGAAVPFSQDPDVDNFYFVGSGPALASLAYAAPTTDDLAAFTSHEVTMSTNYCGNPDSIQPVRIGSESGNLVTQGHCGILVYAAVTVHNGTGYYFVFRDPSVSAASNAADSAVFQQLLDSVVFRN